MTNHRHHQGPPIGGLVLGRVELEKLVQEQSRKIIQREQRVHRIAEILFRASERSKAFEEMRKRAQIPEARQSIHEVIQPFFRQLAAAQLLEQVAVIAEADPLGGRSIRLFRGTEQLRVGLDGQWPQTAEEFYRRAEEHLDTPSTQTKSIRSYTPLRPFTVAVELFLSDMPYLRFHFWPKNSGGLAVAYAVVQNEVNIGISDLAARMHTIDPAIWLQIAQSIQRGEAESEFIRGVQEILQKGRRR